MKRVLIIALSVLTIISCKNNQDKNANEIKDSTKQNVSKVIEKELPYFDSTTMSKNGEVGYQDTFSVDKLKFRVIHHDTLFDGIIQKFEQGKWGEVLSFESLGNHNNYFVDKDLNNDGYNDICLEWKWDMETFFYNPKLKTFTNKSIRLPSSWYLIDKEKGIYCNYQEGKTADATSELYTIKNFEKVVLAHIEFKSRADDNQILDKAELYKDKSKVEELKVNKDEEFNYVKWWTENYKRVL